VIFLLFPRWDSNFGHQVLEDLAISPAPQFLGEKNYLRHVRLIEGLCQHPKYIYYNRGSKVEKYSLLFHYINIGTTKFVKMSFVEFFRQKELAGWKLVPDFLAEAK
jgi:hypothetical protein